MVRGPKSPEASRNAWRTAMKFTTNYFDWGKGKDSVEKLEADFGGMQ
jgi:hypothetical protein